MARETAERVVVTLPWEDECPDIEGAPSLEIFDDRQPNGTNGFTLLAVFQPKQLTSVSASVHFKPIISLRRQPVSAS